MTTPTCTRTSGGNRVSSVILRFWYPVPLVSKLNRKILEKGNGACQKCQKCQKGGNLSWGQGGNCRSVPANEYNYRNVCGMRGDITERSLMSWNDEQEAEELATHGSFGVLTAKRGTFVGYGTG